jgi:hypothetical protein
MYEDGVCQYIHLPVAGGKLTESNFHEIFALLQSSDISVFCLNIKTICSHFSSCAEGVLEDSELMDERLWMF